MKKEQLFLTLSIILILILLAIAEIQKPVASGEVKKISNSNPVQISLKNQTLEIIAFTKNLDLKPGSQVEIYGTKQSEQEIIAHKIKCLNC